MEKEPLFPETLLGAVPGAYARKLEESCAAVTPKSAPKEEKLP